MLSQWGRRTLLLLKFGSSLLEGWCWVDDKEVNWSPGKEEGAFLAAISMSSHRGNRKTRQN